MKRKGITARRCLKEVRSKPRPDEQKSDTRPRAMGELAADSETRDSQDRPGVNPAGAGRKNERLSREGRHAARGLATRPATGWDGVAAVSRGHSTRGDPGKGRTSSHKAPRRGSHGNETANQKTGSGTGGATGLRLGGGG